MMSSFWDRLNTHRPSLVRPSGKESDSDEGMPAPETKNEVFQMFAKPSKKSRFSRGYSCGSDRELSRSPNKRDSCQGARNLRLTALPRHTARERSPSPAVFESCSNLEQIGKSEKPVYTTYLSPANVVVTLHPSPTSKSRLSDTPFIDACEPEDAKTGNKEAGPSEISSSSAEQKEKGKRRSSQLIKRGSTTMEPIKKVNFDDVYSVYKQVGLGRFGQLKLAENKNAKCKIALRYFPTAQFKQVDFIREYNCSFFLSPHPNVIDTYEGMFQAHDDSAFFFVQEICSGITLKEAVEGSSSGIGEPATRSVMEKVLSALEFMHSENLVHRYIRAESILIFDPREYSKVKLTNFGLTKKVDSSVKYQDIVSGSNYHAPELCETVVNEFYTVSRAIDMWAIGIVFYYCLKGKFPWQKASIMCKPYWEWEQWLKRKSPQLPKRWEPFSEKSLKILKKTLNPKHKDRWSAKDVRKCILKEKLLKPTKVAEE